MYCSRLVIRFILGVFRFILFVSHLLGILLRLEFLVLLIFSSVVLVLGLRSLYISLVFLIFRVCEGVLGLTILVIMSRVFGTDTLNSFRLII